MNSPLLIAGVDEVGRGPLAGPVVAAAVILDRDSGISGMHDSKILTTAKREKLAQEIMERSIAWSIARAEVHEIDTINILQASLLAMARCIQTLSTRPDKVLVDGKFCPDIDIPSEAIIKGDQTVQEISAASIIAKVYRDNEMQKLDRAYPGYGFAQHKGYPTRDHISALNQLGACPIHRKSFSPVRKVIESTSR